MGKAWRRSARVVPSEPVPDAPVLTDIGSEAVEAAFTHDEVLFPYVWWYFGPTASGPWEVLITNPITTNPQNADYAGHMGEYAMARVGTGAQPLSPQSNVVEVTA